MPEDYKSELIAYRIERARECINDTEKDELENQLAIAKEFLLCVETIVKK